MEAFGQVHMLSHLSGASVCTDRRLRLKLENQNSTLTSELKVLKCRYDNINKKFHEQSQLLNAERAKAGALLERANQLTNPQQSTPKSTARDADEAKHVINPLRKKYQLLRQNVLEGRAKQLQQSKEIERLQRLLSGYEKKNRQTDVEKLKLCGQCVLYLGGKVQQRRHFQAPVESCEGQFLHHDGGRETCHGKSTHAVC